VTSDDDAMIRSEERLTVSTEEQETGKVRLRKHLVTEYVTVTVPVRHEEVRLEHVPPTGGDHVEAGEVVEAGEDAGSDPEMVLYAERPVVSTETVPVERVRLGKQTVTGEETVTGVVRKEHIEVELAD
jgi:uncharacterized protein (TIGR02271 family)